MANQYDPIVPKSGILTVLGSDTLRADRVGSAFTTTGLAAGDACQVSGALTLGKAVNTSTSPIVGIYDGETGAVVRKGVVVATFKSGLTLANGDAVYLSSTAGALTNVKPTADMLHEVGVVVDYANQKVLLQQKPVISLQASPPPLIIVGCNDKVTALRPSDGTVMWSTPLSGFNTINKVVFDGEFIWATAYYNANGPTYKLNTTTGAIVGAMFYTNAGGGYGTVHAWDGTRLWASDITDHPIRVLNADGSLYTTYAYGSAKALLYDGQGNMWTYHGWSGGNPEFKVKKIRVSDGAQLGQGVQNVPDEYYVADYLGCVDANYVYVGESLGANPFKIHRYRISDLNYACYTFSSVDSVVGPHALAQDGTYLYALCGRSSNHKIVKIRLSDMTEVARYEATFGQNGTFACDGTYLWVADYGNHHVQRVTCADGTVATYGNITDTPFPLGVCHTLSKLPWP